MALALDLPGERRADTDRADVVDLGEPDRGVVVLPGLLLVAEDAERDEDDVEVAAGRGLCHQRGVAVGVGRLEVELLDAVARAR